MRFLGLFGLFLFYSTAIGQNFYDATFILIAGNVQRMDVSMDGFPSGLYFVEVNGKTYKWMKN